MSQKPQFGLTGLAVMGQNLARNVAHHGFPIAVHNRTASKVDEFLADFGSEGAFVGAHSLKELVEALEAPRTILIMVKAGGPVDAVIDELVPLLSLGDTLIDGGNSLYTDTQRRNKDLTAKGLNFLGVGVSGGEEGALNGPSIMPGGQRDAYERIAPIFEAISAKVDGTPCVAYIGADGAGHYVKMIHNGIEYADMQLIAEAYDLLKNVCGLSNEELAKTFGEWNEGDLDSFLIEITTQIFQTKDTLTDGHLVDFVLDKAAQKGTGKWTSQNALDLGIPVTGITEAVFARCLSALKDERVAASTVLPGPTDVAFHGDKAAFINDIRDALYCSKIVAYAQGIQQMDAAAAEFGWSLNRGEIATIWRGGCIIRARFLNRIKDAYDTNAELANLMLDPYFTDGLASRQAAWRRVVGEAVKLGVPVPAFASSLAYYDGYRRASLPANLIQAQRDLFGAHTYERTDREGTFHSSWGA
ncbi:NADP-dependent phosphogluconate dehydrogenase [Armatimonas sp.]|uniref:NADP-dependent phosphogluconate dehydrogenase n=1 Tax=Armatimonas sp. TaxID=1872638 RepID=UPI00286C016A|nr:NADP-dependent phosphogluconate dehydrogenase [Armatimonas sp.]